MHVHTRARAHTHTQKKLLQGKKTPFSLLMIHSISGLLKAPSKLLIKRINARIPLKSFFCCYSLNFSVMTRAAGISREMAELLLANAESSLHMAYVFAIVKYLELRERERGCLTVETVQLTWQLCS